MFEPNGPTSRLSQGEITDCLLCALASLDPIDQANIMRVMDPLLDIPRMGPVSALQLLFAIYRADDLARLDKTLANQAKANQAKGG